MAVDHELRVTYANDSRHGAKPDWIADLAGWEYYLDKAAPADFADYVTFTPDVVFVVTPDWTHVDIVAKWLGRAALVFVEKPFDIDPKKVEALLRTLDDSGTEVFGLDHYLCYILPLIQASTDLDEFLGPTIESVEFVLTETKLIPVNREASLLSGMTFDLLPHGLALSLLFGRLDAVADISVISVGSYTPRVCSDDDGKWIPMTRFQAETCSLVEFSVPQIHQDDRCIRVRSLVGKGFGNSVKYFEARSPSGRFVRVDFGPPDKHNCPAGYVFFGLNSDSEGAVSDRYLASRHMQIAGDPPAVLVPRSRYAALVTALATGAADPALALALTVEEALDLVTTLATIVEAVRRKAGQPYTLGEVQIWQDLES